MTFRTARTPLRRARRGANLDLCNKFSGTMLADIRRFAAANVLADTAVVAVTLMKGRESPEVVASLQILAERCGLEWNRDAGRPFFALLLLSEALQDRAWTVWRSGEYRSGSKNMVWAVALTATHEALYREAAARGWRSEYGYRYDTRGDERSPVQDAYEYARWRQHGRARYYHGPLAYWGAVTPGVRGSAGAGGRLALPPRAGGSWVWSTREPSWDEPVADQLRTVFASANAAQDYFHGTWSSGPDRNFTDGMWGWTLNRVWQRYRYDVARHHHDCTVQLPWSGSWRNAPNITSKLHAPYLPTLSLRHNLAPVTQPFDTWRINNPKHTGS